MPHLNVNASLYVAGAFAQLQSDTNPWYFAVALSGGWSEAPPPGAELDKWREALLPWVLAKDCKDIMLYDAENGSLLGRAERIAPDPGFDSMVEAIKEETGNGLARLQPDLVWSGGQDAELSFDAEQTPAAAAVPALHGPALLHTLTRLPAPLALGLSATIYFACDAKLRTALQGVSLLAAVPDKLHDLVGELSASHGAVSIEAGQVVRCDYAGTDAPVVYSEALDLAAARSSALSEVLAGYWLKVETGGGSRLNDIDRTIAKILRAASNVEFVSPNELSSGTTKWMHIGTALPNLAQAQEFWTKARAAAAALDGEEKTEEVRELALAQARAALLKRVFAIPGATVRERLYAAFQERLEEHWASILAALSGLPAGFTFEGKAAAAALLENIFPKDPPAAPDSAATGLPFCVGEPAARLLYAADDDGSSSVAALTTAEQQQPELGLEQISAVGVLVQREQQPWRLVTAGVPVAAEVEGLFDGSTAAGRWLPRMLPSGLTVAFVNELCSLDFNYDGVPMRTPDPLHRVHDGEFANEAPGAGDLGTLAPFGLHGAGALTGAVEGREHCKAPPLRYGDRYRLAAFAIDKVGGLPAALAGDAPWTIDWNALATLAPPVHSAETRFLRRRLPGPVSLGYVTASRSWPQVPEGVVLRALEAKPGAQPANPVDGGTIPALLVSADKALNALQSHTVRLVPPTIDEHTLTPWAMPPAGQPGGGAEQARLFAALRMIHLNRQKPLPEGEDRRKAAMRTDLFPHDPAIDSFLVAGHWVDREGKRHAFPASGAGACVAPLAWPADGYLIAEDALPLLAVVAGSGTVTTLRYSGADRRVTLELAPGSYAVLAISPVIGRTAVDRFDPAVLAGHGAAGPAPGSLALAPEVLVAEHAVADLPAADQLYAALELRPLAKSVEIALQACPGLAFVDSFALQRQRWVWRNRPLLSPALASDPALTEAERRRLLASGLPLDALSDRQDIRDSDAMRQYDELAELDKGLVDRPDHAARFPRERDGAGRTLLLVDLLEAADRAEYLRYGVQLGSRYAPLFKDRDRALVRARRNGDTWRRIAMPYRGNGVSLRPPKVMAVVPLTQGFALPDGSRSGKEQATPVLIVLDDIWFREFGPGDRLEVRLALENADIGEDARARRPYRTGGLPDHHLARPHGSTAPYEDPGLYYGGKLVTDEEDAAAPVLLDVFGPFGYSLDRSGNQALSNATAFVAFPPAGVAPHFAMFVRLARVLDLPSQGQRSALTDTYPVYTLPGAGDLLAPGGSEGCVYLRSGTSAGSFALRWQDLTPNCRPWTPPAAAPADEQARANYMYCMLVSELVADGGRGFDAELPVAMLALDARVQPVQGSLIPANGLASGRRYQARMLELLLNGKEASRDGLTGAQDLAGFWRKLLPERDDDKAGDDALAMIRRVSPPFSLEVED